MALSRRKVRRLAGLFSARIPELCLGSLLDPRKKRGKRWPLAALLISLLFGLIAGCCSLAQTEELSASLSPSLRRKFKLFRRTPDTTLRDLLVKMSILEARKLLHRQTKLAFRRKALSPLGVPFGVLAMDGKETQLPAWDEEVSQFVHQGNSAYGLARTLTCCLVSSQAKVCIDMIPIPPQTNEMGHFQTALTEVLSVYGKMGLFEVVSYDSGANSKENADFVHGKNLGYFFVLKANQPTLLGEAQRLLGGKKASEALGETTDVRGNEVWVRRVYLTTEMKGYHEWAHLQTVLRVETEKQDKAGNRLESESRYFVTNLMAKRLSGEQWLNLVRSHWGVENGVHWTLDAAFKEDEHPWIKNNPHGMCVIACLRRVAYNLVSLYRSVTQRGEEQRQTAWRTLLSWIREVLRTAEEEAVSGLRERREVGATR